MPYHENPPIYIREVYSHFRESVYFKNVKDIINFVEYPLIAACIIFWQKNILTTWSTANKTDSNAILSLDVASLSTQNQDVARSARLKIPIHPDMLVSDVESHFVDQANFFKKQKATWIPRLTIAEAQQSYSSYSFVPGPNRTHVLRPVPEFVELMINENVGYFSKEEKMFYLSYEHYQKFHELI